MNKIMIKIDRFSAWVLFGGMLLYFVSGYGMTKGLIDASFAAKLHLDILTYIILVAFIFHTSFAIHLAFKRWRIWNGATAALLVLFYLLFISGFIYIDKYYKLKTDDGTPAESTAVETTSNSDTDNTANVETAAKTFTLTELAKYDGQDGNPAYLAVDGQVYDLSSVFQQGKHFSHYAGKELTNAFYSYHVKSVLAKYPIVGTLVK